MKIVAANLSSSSNDSNMSEAGPGRFGGQVSVTDIYHTMPCHASINSHPTVVIPTRKSNSQTSASCLHSSAPVRSTQVLSSVDREIASIAAHKHAFKATQKKWAQLYKRGKKKTSPITSPVRNATSTAAPSPQPPQLAPRGKKAHGKYTLTPCVWMRRMAWHGMAWHCT
jgi:predicted metalloprotease